MFCNKLDNLSDNTYSNRIIFITDIKSNICITNENNIYLLIKNAQNNKNIFTTFINIGINIKINILNYLNNIKGFNYFYINNSNDFD